MSCSVFEWTFSWSPDLYFAFKFVCVAEDSVGTSVSTKRKKSVNGTWSSSAWSTRTTTTTRTRQRSTPRTTTSSSSARRTRTASLPPLCVRAAARPRGGPTTPTKGKFHSDPFKVVKQRSPTFSRRHKARIRLLLDSHASWDNIRQSVVVHT